MRITKSLTPLLLLACLAVAITGCSRQDPLDAPAKVADQTDYNLWRNKTSTDLSPVQWKDLDAAIQEIKFDVMMRDKVSGADAQQAATLAKINGLTPRQIVLKGLGLKRTRLENDKRACEEQKRENDKLVTAEGDYAAAQALAKIRKDHADFFEKVSYDLDQTEKALLRYEKTSER